MLAPDFDKHTVGLCYLHPDLFWQEEKVDPSSTLLTVALSSAGTILP